MYHTAHLSRNSDLELSLDFVSRNRQVLFTTNRPVIWTVMGASGKPVKFHIIKTGLTHLLKTGQYLSTWQIDTDKNYPALGRAVATAIDDGGCSSFFSLKADEVDSASTGRGLRLTIRNLVFKDNLNRGILIIPELPTGRTNTPESWLIGQHHALAASRIREIIFNGGNRVILPDWFREICFRLGIQITQLEAPVFSERFNAEPLIANGS
jgi:hypothetical protein